LKRLLAVIAALSGTVAVVAAVFLARPGVFLTDRTVAAAVKYLGLEWAPRWSRLGFSAAALEWGRHRYVLSAADVCVDERRGAFSGCFPELSLGVIVRYTLRGPIVESVDHVVLVAESARLDLRRFPAGKDPASKSWPMPAVRAAHVELPRFELLSAKTNLAGGLRAILTAGPRPLLIRADVRIRDAKGQRRLKAALTADTDLLKGKGPATYVDIRARAELSAQGRAQAAFRVRREGLRYVGSGGAEVVSSTGPLKVFRLADCRGAARPAGGGASCRFELVARNPLPASLGSMKALSGRVALSGGLGARRYHGRLKAVVDPVTEWYELAGSLGLRVEGRLDRPFAAASLRHELRASAKAARFEDLVAALRDTKYAVPAPLHVLKGPLSLSVDSRGDPRSPKTAAHYDVSSDLSAGRQRLTLRAQGTVTSAAGARGRSFEHAGELILKDVAIELPHIDIGRTAKVVYDKRITTADALPEVSTATWRRARFLSLHAKLAVKTEKPLILFLNLVKDPVPVALDLTAAYPPGTASGTVAIKRFKVELFRRDAALEHLNVYLSSNSKEGALEGLVSYQSPKAAINILILGTTEKPRIELTSVPPMKREDIIALLIFGKSPDDLDPEQAVSVSNTETGLASRAFGLASLYFFGATPIERVGYDPATKTTSVSFRLPGGANLTVGSDFEQSRQISVRKTLAPHWAIQSEISDQGQENKAVATFLEWFRRY
jgi:hypothetical protein